MVIDKRIKVAVLKSIPIIDNKNIIKIFGVSKQSIYNWNKNKKFINGYKCRQSKYTAEIKCFIRQYVISKVSFSMKKLISRIKAKFFTVTNKTCIYNIIKALKITRKKIKKKTILKNLKTIKREIHEFKKNIKNIPIHKIISIDESSFDTHLTPLYGWSKSGKKIIKIQKKRYKRFTIICAINNSKIICYKIIKGSANALCFRDFLDTVFDKTGDNNILLLDNAPIHHSRIVKEYMKNKQSELLFNVPYSPELNPIENVFSKSKYIVRSFDNNDNEKNLFKNIKYSFDMITPNDLCNFFANSFQ